MAEQELGQLKPNPSASEVGAQVGPSTRRKKKSRGSKRKEKPIQQETLRSNLSAHILNEDEEALAMEAHEIVIETGDLRRRASRKLLTPSQLAGQCSPLRGYTDYLAAVINEGDGRISKEQYNTLESLRIKYAVSHLDHVKALGELGWTEDEFEAAKNQVPMEYLTYLRAILADGVVDAAEAKSLEDLRRKHDLRDHDHLNALKQIGYSERDFLMACAKGASTRTESRFGRSSTKIRTGEVEKMVHCHGLCIAPHLRQWWEIDPKSGKRVLIREPGADNRTATSQELFYDLVFVAVIAKLVHLFAVDHTKWLEFLVLFSCIWRIWSTSTNYNTVWDARDLSVKIAMYAQMLGLVYMGITIDDAFEFGGTRSFAAGFVLAHVPILVLYTWAFAIKKKGWQFAAILLGQTLVSPTIFLLSAILSGDLYGHGYLWWWIAGLLAPDILTIVTVCSPRLLSYRQPINVEHMTERFGLFIIIVLGESITSILADLPWRGDLINWEVYLCAGAGLAVAFSLKWIYFDVDEEKRKHPYRRGRMQALPWSFSHWPLAIAITMSAAGCYGLIHTIVFYIEAEVFHHNVTALSGGAVHKRYFLDVDASEPAPPVVEAVTNETSSHDSHGYSGGITVEKSHEILMCVGIAVSLFIFALQSAVSKHPKKQLVKARVRLIIRCIVATAIALLPAGDYGYGGLILLMIVAILTTCLSIFEMISILPKHADAHEGELDELEHADVDTVRAFVSRSYSKSLLVINPGDEANKSVTTDVGDVTYDSDDNAASSEKLHTLDSSGTTKSTASNSPV